MKQETIRVVKVEVGKQPYVKEIANTLESLQAEVGGLIQPVELGENCIAIVNEEGKLLNLEGNRWLGNDDIICGDFFICADDGENFGSLNDIQVLMSMEYFKEIPEFTGQELELQPQAFVIGFEPMGGLE